MRVNKQTDTNRLRFFTRNRVAWQSQTSHCAPPRFSAAVPCWVTWSIRHFLSKWLKVWSLKQRCTTAQSLATKCKHDDIYQTRSRYGNAARSTKPRPTAISNKHCKMVKFGGSRDMCEDRHTETKCYNSISIFLCWVVLSGKNNSQPTRYVQEAQLWQTRR